MSIWPAQDHLLLTADSPLVDAVLLATYLVAAGVLIAVTRGRLATEVRNQTQAAINDDQSERPIVKRHQSSRPSETTAAGSCSSSSRCMPGITW